MNKLSFFLSGYFLILLTVFGVAFDSEAQERAASGVMETQMTWSALSNIAKGAGDKADAVNSRVNQIVVCGRKNMIYAPNAIGVDAEGCVIGKVDPDLIATINNMTTCARDSKIYNPTTNSCVSTESSRWVQTSQVDFGDRAPNRNTMAAYGITACTVYAGQKCTTNGQRCGVMSSNGYFCGQQNDSSCTNHSAVIFTCN